MSSLLGCFGSSSAVAPDTKNACMICLEEMRPLSDTISTVCKFKAKKWYSKGASAHKFHYECIARHFDNQKNNCPLCRRVLEKREITQIKNEFSHMVGHIYGNQSAKYKNLVIERERVQLKILEALDVDSAYNSQFAKLSNKLKKEFLFDLHNGLTYAINKNKSDLIYNFTKKADIELLKAINTIAHEYKNALLIQAIDISNRLLPEAATDEEMFGHLPNQLSETEMKTSETEQKSNE